MLLLRIISVGLLLPGVQSNAIASSMHNAIHVPQMVNGCYCFVVILGLIIFGGVRRYCQCCNSRCTIYGNYLHTDGCHYHLYQYTRVPARYFALIFKSAFGLQSAFGGIVGAMIELVLNVDYTQMRLVKVQVHTQQRQQKYHIQVNKV